MRISVLNSINNYSKVISDYKFIRNKFASKPTKVCFKNNNYEIKTQRKPDDIAQYIIDAKLKDSPKIDKQKERQEKLVEKYDNHIGLLRKAPMLDRIDYAIAKLKKGEYVSATTLGILSIVYGPEDLREVGSAYEQIKALVKNEKFIKEYDYKTAQHPYSFFRGSILHKALNPFKTKNIERSLKGFAKLWNDVITEIKFWLLEKDKALIDTRFGEKFLDKFNIDIKTVDTPIEDIPKINNNPKYIKAYEFISDSKFGKLTARAMTRVPVIGTFTDATIEALEARNDVKNGEDFLESTAKAGARYAFSTITTAYLGPVGTLGSLTLANYINDKFEEIID